MSDTIVKIIPGVGYIAIDSEASPGAAGHWAVVHYASGYDASGFESFEEALEELEFLCGE